MRTMPRLVAFCASFAIFASGPLACKERQTGAALRSDGAGDTAGSEAAPRVEAQSVWHYVPESAVDLHLSYSGFIPENGSPTEGERFRRLAIGRKALEMVGKARTTIVASAFLFDSMYAINPEGAAGAPDAASVEEERRITEVFRDALLKKRRDHPDMLIVVVLDPINRAYVDRVSEAVRQFHEAGIDVFFSDLAATPAVGQNNPLMQALQQMHRNDMHVEDLQASAFQAVETAVNEAAALHPVLGGKLAPVKQQLEALKQGKPLIVGGQPLVLDGQPVTLELLYNVALLKANHRKLLVTDDGSGYEALVSSANPHNASFGAANSALSIKGDMARYVYNVIREDVRFCIERQKQVETKFASRPELASRYGKRFAYWSKAREDATARAGYLTTTFPPLLAGAPGKQTAATPVAAQFITESKIADSIIAMLGNANPDDEIRIQMFYLSYQPVIDAILDAAARAEKPVRLILDPNKDAFNNIKDGTPNRQVARYMLAQKRERGLKLELRWYSTHGEQNHAKIMTVTNARTGKYEAMTGSGNWTGKNIAGPNMEANLVVKGAIGATRKFNDLFEMFWQNTPEPGSSRAVEYTIAYDDPRYKYHEQTADDAKWLNGEKSGMVAW